MNNGPKPTPERQGLRPEAGHSGRPTTPEDDGSPVRTGGGKAGPLWERRPALVGALLAVVIAGFVLHGRSTHTGAEHDAPAWRQHVEALNRQFDSRFEGASEAEVEMKRVDASGAEQMTRHIQLEQADFDQAANQAVYDAMGSTADAAARRSAMQDALQRAQQVPAVPAPNGRGDLQVEVPELTPGMVTAFEGGQMRMWRLFLYDDCDEDGDVVDVMLNGATFAVVPIANQGATLSIPLVQGATTTIALRGVKDGGGGITVACRTSTGTYFSRAMYPGEVQILGTIGR